MKNKISNKKNKARKPVQKRSIETKQKIIEAAEFLFAEKGYYKTNALEIAAQANVATGSFYSYFNNKKEIFIEVMRNFYLEASEKVLSSYQAKMHNNKTSNNREFKKLIHSMIHAFYNSHDINPSLHRELVAMTLLDNEIREINREEERKVIAMMTKMLNTYKTNIRVKDLEAASELLFRVTDEIVHRIKIIGTDIDGGRLLNELEDMIYKYLLDE